jgi:hypothetical protein
VTCKLCGTGDEKRFLGEIALHFPGLQNIDKPTLFLFPEIFVCSTCGAAAFVVPETELRLLAAIDADATNEGGSKSHQA